MNEYMSKMPDSELSTPAGKAVETKTNQNRKHIDILGGAFAVTAIGLVAAFMYAHDPEQHEPGERLADGTIYAGSGLFTTPADMDIPSRATWSFAMNYCDTLSAHRHNDWRLPNSEELNVLFTNQAAIGGFDQSVPWPAGFYWSSSERDNSSARNQRFSDGNQGFDGILARLAVRCVR